MYVYIYIYIYILFYVQKDEPYTEHLEYNCIASVEKKHVHRLDNFICT